VKDVSDEGMEISYGEAKETLFSKTMLFGLKTPSKIFDILHEDIMY
jgi:hypothetical protein